MELAWYQEPLKIKTKLLNSFSVAIDIWCSFCKHFKCS